MAIKWTEDLSTGIEKIDDQHKELFRRNYPGYDGHKTQHESFIKKFTEFKEKLEQSGPTVDLVVKMNGFLVDWLINHIKKTDRALGDYLKR